MIKHDHTRSKQQTQFSSVIFKKTMLMIFFSIWWVVWCFSLECSIFYASASWRSSLMTGFTAPWMTEPVHGKAGNFDRGWLWMCQIQTLGTPIYNTYIHKYIYILYCTFIYSILSSFQEPSRVYSKTNWIGWWSRVFQHPDEVLVF